MRLAIVRQRYTPYGGAERFIARALPALERAGAEVTLIAREAQGWGARRVLRVDPFHIGKVWRDWSFARAARAAWRREGFDVVQSHERIPGCDVYRAGDGVPTSPGAKNRVPTKKAWPLIVSVVFAWARNVMPGKLVGSVAVADPLKLTGA